VSAWLDGLRARLPRHAALLDALVALCEADERIEVLEIQCSIARGAGDEWSDLDVGIGAVDAAWEAVAASVPDRLRAVAETVDVLEHRIDEWGARPHRRIFCQFADGRQVDLVVQPVSNLAGRVPSAVVLYDPAGHLAQERRPPALTATADDVRTWEVLGWELLANVAKYLARGSPWEAHERLEGARAMALRVYAAAENVAYPAFGLTSLLDADPPRLPDDLDATVAGLDAAALRGAAVATGTLLRRTAADARRRLNAEHAESPMAQYVVALLEDQAPGR
jgi:hypothetical protein